MKIHARHITSLVSTAILLGVAAQKDNRDALSYIITAYLPDNQTITLPSGYEPAEDIYGLFSDRNNSLYESADRALAVSYLNSTFRPITTEVKNFKDPSVVFILNLMENGKSSYGTGTIIRGEDGVNNVLTAEHVITSDDPVVKSIAFSYDGKALAELSPVSYGVRSSAVEVASVVNDVGVMRPSVFLTSEAEKEWASRAVNLANNLPIGMMLLLNAQTDHTLSQGVSGGSLRNLKGEVIGVVSASVYREDIQPPFGAGEYFKAISNNDDIFSPEEAYALKYLATQRKWGHETAGVGFAAPLVHDFLYESLNLNKDNFSFVEISNGFKATIAGYPNLAPVKGDVNVSMAVLDARDQVKGKSYLDNRDQQQNRME